MPALIHADVGSYFFTSGRQISIGYGTSRFKFVENLGPLFFGIAVVLFIQSIRTIHQATYSRVQKLAYGTFAIVTFIFGLVAFILDAQETSMYLRPTGSEGNNSFSATVVQSQEFYAPKVHALMVVLTSWLAGGILVFRTWVLYAQAKWVAVALGTLYGAIIIAEAVMLGLGFYQALPAYPTANLLLSLVITVLILLQERKTFVSKSAFFKAVLVESGALMTLGLLLYTIFTFSGVAHEPMQSLLPHVHLIVGYLVILRSANGVEVGKLRLSSSDNVESANARV